MKNANIPDIITAEEALRQSNASLRTINTISDAVYLSLDFDTVVKNAAKAMDDFFHAPSVSVFMLNEKEHCLDQVFASDPDIEPARLIRTLPLKKGSITALTVARQEIVICEDVSKDKIMRPDVRAAIIKWGRKTILSLPLLSHDQVLGAMNLFFKEKRTFTQSERETFLSIGKTIGLALANARHVSQIKEEIAERKRTEEAMQRSEEKYRSIIEDMQEGYFENDLAGNFTFINDALCRLIGYPREELIGKNSRQYTDEKTAKKIYQIYNKIYRTGEPIKGIEEEYIRKDGIKVVAELSVSLIHDAGDNPIGFRGIARDITERKQAEQTLQESEEKYRLVVENAKEAIFITQDVQLVFINRAAVNMIGYSEEILTSKPFTDFIHPDDRDMVVNNHIKRLKGEEFPPVYSFRVIDQGGSVRWVELNAALIQWKGKPAVLNFINDITERRRAEEALRESEDKYKSLVNNISDIIFTIDLEGKITFVSQRTKEILGYEKAEMINMNILNFIPEEDRQRALESLQKGMTGEKITNFQIPIITKSGERLFFECSFSRVYKDGAVVGAQGTAVDITERKQAEEERKQSFERMRKALSATVQAISITVEMKDPYTSGHQQRVSDLARAMATEMGLSADRRDFIRTAASIHDIGKIAIPSEILSKPTKLTDLEFNLIKTHSQSGYDILKDIEFPWPVADVVLQHHERMDGSGYPQGLKGDDILLEARILAVADVVESMASHRPYRPALGIKVALGEIEKNKGILYDDTVTDACLKLFREKDYQLKRI